MPPESALQHGNICIAWVKLTCLAEYVQRPAVIVVREGIVRPAQEPNDFREGRGGRRLTRTRTVGIRPIGSTFCCDRRIHQRTHALFICLGIAVRGIF